ncbi:MAG: hypothetical protein JO126_03160 [Alphaproteobacteria bacterium]|nr:hypothetical protein [Alphaproteobacteria bacterium]MBV8548440.1 hypothetical protein [Alphaproteobacteria bacterium]
MGRELSVWAMLAKPSLGEWRRRIEDIAGAFGAAPFDPHITVYCGKQGDDVTLDAVRRAAAEHAPFTLRVTQLVHGVLFNKNLYYEFERHETPFALCKRIIELADPEPYYVPNPHMSVLYSGDFQKTLAAASHCLAPSLVGELRFDSLRVIQGTSPLQSNDHVMAWKTLLDVPLGG